MSSGPGPRFWRAAAVCTGGDEEGVHAVGPVSRQPLHFWPQGRDNYWHRVGRLRPEVGGLRQSGKIVAHGRERLVVVASEEGERGGVAGADAQDEPVGVGLGEGVGGGAHRRRFAEPNVRDPGRDDQPVGGGQQDARVAERFAADAWGLAHPERPVPQPLDRHGRSAGVGCLDRRELAGPDADRAQQGGSASGGTVGVDQVGGHAVSGDKAARSSGWAIAIRARRRSAAVRPRSRATPYSVTT